MAGSFFFALTVEAQMNSAASEIARRLGREAEAVCRHYLSNGRKQVRYWIVGDIENTSGRSLYVRLTGPAHGPGAAGKWTDAATGEHGDLLDLIAGVRQLRTFGETLDEARLFLSLPRPEPPIRERVVAPTGSPEAARRLFAMGRPVGGTLAERIGAVFPGLATRRRFDFIRTATIGAKVSRKTPHRRPGLLCSPRSPTETAISPASTAPGSTLRQHAKLRSIRHARRWGICSAMACG
ncbi:hypothetical protein ABC955_01775 [Citromicrobium bathyomarinum]